MRHDVFVALADRAEDGEVGVVGLEPIDPGRQIADYDVAHAVDLIVAARKETPVVPGVVEAKGLHLGQVVRIETLEIGHLRPELLADGGLEARLEDDVFFGLLNDVEVSNVRIHIGIDADPVHVVMAVNVRVGLKPEFLPPARDERGPEKIRDGQAVRLFVPQRLFDAFELGETGRGACDRHEKLLKANFTSWSPACFPSFDI